MFSFISLLFPCSYHYKALWTSRTNGTSAYDAQSLTVIGDGLSVTRFFNWPLLTLASMSLKTLSLSPFWASLTVIGDGLSVTRFLIWPLVTLASISLKTESLSDFWANLTVMGEGLSVSTH